VSQSLGEGTAVDIDIDMIGIQRADSGELSAFRPPRSERRLGTVGPGLVASPWSGATGDPDEPVLCGCRGHAEPHR
jgi:hypothetical protein